MQPVTGQWVVLQSPYDNYPYTRQYVQGAKDIYAKWKVLAVFDAKELAFAHHNALLDNAIAHQADVSPDEATPIQTRQLELL